MSIECMELPEVIIPLCDFLYISCSTRQTGIQGDKIQRINQGTATLEIFFSLKKKIFYMMVIITLDFSCQNSWLIFNSTLLLYFILLIPERKQSFQISNLKATLSLAFLIAWYFWHLLPQRTELPSKLLEMTAWSPEQLQALSIPHKNVSFFPPKW